jgi:hypothetical protein
MQINSNRRMFRYFSEPRNIVEKHCYSRMPKVVENNTETPILRKVEFLSKITYDFLKFKFQNLILKGLITFTEEYF